MPALTLTGARVLLRPVRPDDGPALVEMFQEPAVARWWPRYDAERVEREVVGDDDPETTVYAVDVDGVVAGIVQCGEETEPDYRQASIDIAVATAWHGTGVAVDALRTLARHLVDDLGHHHLTIDPAAANARAIACYSKIGFRPVGVLRQNERGPDGTFHDTLFMDLVAAELR
ncbi:MAG: GNAT family N-acetyltransferase [Acidimicrobiales bacterium]